MDKNSPPKSLTELEKVGPTFSSLFSLACTCLRGDIAPLTVWLHKGPSMNPCFFQLGLISYGQGLMIFHKVNPRTHHNYL